METSYYKVKMGAGRGSSTAGGFPSDRILPGKDTCPENSPAAGKTVTHMIRMAGEGQDGVKEWVVIA